MNRTAKQVAYGALAAALIMVATALIKVPGPVVGYMHIGDGVLFAMAMLLGPRIGALSAGAGSMLADLMAGYGVYAPVTFVIKAAMGYLAGRFANGGFLQRLMVFFLCEALMVSGYFAFETAMYGVNVAVGSVLFNLIQSAFGIVLGLCFTGSFLQRFAKTIRGEKADEQRP